MATPIGYAKIRKGTENLNIPVYALADLFDSRFRVRLEDGTTGCFRLVSPTSANAIRITTASGVVLGVDLTIDTPVSKNLLRYSQDWTQSLWVKGANTTGYNTGRITMAAGSGTYASQQVSVTAGQAYTVSVFATRTTASNVNFTVAIGSSASSGDLFYSPVYTATATETAFRFTFTPTTSTIWVGIDNTGSATALDITAKIQLELGSTGTSYEQTN